MASLGNTGNANASHLHFPIMDGPDGHSVLGSNGGPYVIGNWRRFGFAARFGRVEATPETIGQRFAGFTVDDDGALAEFLKHCAGYARDVGTALSHRLGRRAQDDR